MELSKMYNMTWVRYGGSPSIKILGRDASGRKKTVTMEYPFKPYFFIRESAYNDDVVSIVLERDSTASFKETSAIGCDMQKLIKVELSDADIMLDLAMELKDTAGVFSYEADVPFARRVMVDQGLSVDIPKKKLFFDIEVESTGSFPDPKKADTRILTIAAVDETGKFWSFADNDERKTIEAFLELCNEFEVTAGWSSGNFDWPYLKERCKKLNISFDWFSIVHVDLLPLYRLMSMRNKPSDYKLGTVSKFELGKSKLDIDIANAAELFRKDRAQLEIYNIEDAKLTMEINRKYNMIDILFSIAAISHVPVHGLVNDSKIISGLNHSIAVDGLVLYLAGRRSPRIAYPTRGMMVSKDGSVDTGGYAGGLVFDPVTGLHDNVMSLDFSSLYPSIIRTFNIGVETFRDSDEYDIKAVKHGFVSDPKSVLAEAVEYMGEKRVEYKTKKLACAQGSAEHSVFASQEYAIKTILLSFYGVIGRVGTRYYKKEVAENVTLLGQAFIKKAREIAGREGYDAVMGDSVTKDTPVAIRRNGVTEIVPIQDIVSMSGRLGYPHLGRRTAMGDAEVWTEHGWSRIKYVYIHKVKKTGYRIRTRKSLVEMTEDHSLVVGGENVKPGGLGVGDRIDFVPYVLDGEHMIPADLAWALGLFAAEGTCGSYEYGNNTKHNWSIANQSRELLQRASDALYLHMGFRTKICECSSRGVLYYQLQPFSDHGGHLRSAHPVMVNMFTNLFLTRDGHKLVPSMILNACEKSQRAFVDGYMAGDGHQHGNRMSFATVDPCLAAGLLSIFERLGINYTIKAARRDKPHVVSINTCERGKTGPDEILSIEQFEIDDHVYDLETENHHFVGGLGGVLLHNTDSIYVKFKQGRERDDLVEAFKELAETINAELSVWAKDEFGVQVSHMEMNTERVFSTLFVQAKKKYAGMVVWQDTPQLYMYVVGMEVKRGDWPAAVREFQSELLKMILSKSGRGDKLAYVNKVHDSLLAGELDNDLTIYKGLTRDPDDYVVDAQHVRAAKLYGQGNTTELRKGDKVAYIKFGPKKDDIAAVIRGVVPKIELEGYNYIWRTQFEPIMERLQVSMTKKLDDYF